MNNMGRRHHATDPYVAMLKQSERKAIGYGMAALLNLVIAFFVTSMSSEGSGQFSPIVEQVRYTFGLGLLCACGVSAVLSLWFIGRYVYFFKWPERFE
jgi:hypothetical protein